MWNFSEILIEIGVCALFLSAILCIVLPIKPNDEKRKLNKKYNQNEIK